MGGLADTQRGPLGQPAGARPHLAAVPQTHLTLIGELDAETYRLGQLTRGALPAREIDLWAECILVVLVQYLLP